MSSKGNFIGTLKTGGKFIFPKIHTFLFNPCEFERHSLEIQVFFSQFHIMAEKHYVIDRNINDPIFLKHILLISIAVVILRFSIVQYIYSIIFTL